MVSEPRPMIAAELLLIGAAMADGSKAELIQERFAGEMFQHSTCAAAMEAIVHKDRQMITAFLQSCGINLGEKEKAIDAVARTVIGRAVERHTHALQQAEAVLKAYGGERE